MKKNPYQLYRTHRYTTHNYIIQNVGKNNKVLDVGCNDGYIGLYSDNTNTFFGLDYAKESVLKAKKIYKDAIVYDLNNLEKLPWKTKFDVIVFGDVLEHTLFPAQVLKFFTDNYLQKGGTVIISVPNIANWRTRFGLLLGSFDYTETGILDKTHLHLYTYKTARQLAKSSRLEIVQEYGSSKLFGYLIRLIPSMKHLLAINIILICKK